MSDRVAEIRAELNALQASMALYSRTDRRLYWSMREHAYALKAQLAELLRVAEILPPSQSGSPDSPCVPVRCLIP